MTEGILYKFPTPFVYRIMNPNHDQMKDTLVSQILSLVENTDLSTPETWNCSVTSSFNKRVQFLETTDIVKTLVFDPIDKLMKCDVVIPFNIRQVHLQHIWFNVYEPGQYQEVHTHKNYNVSKNTNIIFSGIYVLSLDEKNPTSFYNLSSSTMFQKEYHATDIREGEIVIFPSCLPHYVNPCQKRRITISFNISYSS